MKEELLRIIANTIAANLNGTDDVSLFHGKMGTCMFLFAYARYSGRTIYETWGDQMLEDVVHAEKSQMMSNIADGYGGIGLGLCWLLQNHFAKGNPDRILQEIDYLFYENIEMASFSEKAYNSPWFAPSVYFSWRKALLPYGNERTKKWEEKVKAAQVDFFVAQSKRPQVTYPENDITSNDGLWWAFARQLTPPAISYSSVSQHLEQIQNDFIYEMPQLNSLLAIWGLYIIINS